MYNNAVLFPQALSINEPWYIKNINFQKEIGELHIYVDFKRGGLFNCKKCGTTNLKAYDTEDKTWRHLNFFQYKAYIHCRTPRSDCPIDGPLLIDVPWARSGSGFTLLFEAFIMELVSQMTVKAIAELVDEQDTRLWRIIHHYVDTARENENYEEVKSIGLDETSSKKGHNYVTVFADMEKSKVIFVTEGKDSTTVDRFKDDFKKHQGKPSNIVHFSCDMSPAFIKGIKENFGWSGLTFDKFHVIKMMNEARDEVRRTEQKERKEELKNTRYIWLKNYNNLTEKQKKKLDSLANSNLKTGKAYRIKIALQDVYASNDKAEAINLLQKWYNWAIRSRIDPIKELAKCIKKHWSGICNYFDSNLTNATLEGINSLVQAAKSRARGYRSIRNYITMIYLIAGKLNLSDAK